MNYLTNSEGRGSSSPNLPHHTQRATVAGNHICNSTMFLKSSPSCSVAEAFPAVKAPVHRAAEQTKLCNVYRQRVVFS